MKVISIPLGILLPARVVFSSAMLHSPVKKESRIISSFADSITEYHTGRTQSYVVLPPKLILTRNLRNQLCLSDPPSYHYDVGSHVQAL